MQNSEKSDTNNWNHQEKQYCPSCAKNGNVSELKLYQINFNEAVYLCPNYEKCLYPVGFEWQFVNRTLDQLYGSDCSDISDSEPEKDEIEDMIQNLMKNKSQITQTKDDLLFLFDNSNNICSESVSNSINGECFDVKSDIKTPDILELPVNIPDSKRIKIVSQEIVIPKEEISYSNEHVLDFSNTTTNDIQCFKVEISNQNQFTIKEIDELINYNDNSNISDIDFNFNLFENNENVQNDSIQTSDSNDSKFTYTVLPADESKQSNVEYYMSNQTYTNIQNCNNTQSNNTDHLLNPITNLKIESEQKTIDNDRYNKWHLIPKSNTETLSTIEATQKKIICSHESGMDAIEVIEFNSTSPKPSKYPQQNSKLKKNMTKNTSKKIKKDPKETKVSQRRTKNPRTQSPKPPDTAKIAYLNNIPKKPDITTKRVNKLINSNLIKSATIKKSNGSSAVLKEKIFGPGRYRPIEL